MRGWTAALCLAALACAAQAQLAPPSMDALSMARKALGDDPGSASVALWQGGKLQQASVRREPGTRPATVMADSSPPPLYEIGSISKVFTGLLLAQAVEKGELSLDDSLGKLLEGKLNFVSPNVAAVTLRQLVTHSSCLPRQFGKGLDGRAIVNQIRKTDRIDLMQALEKQELARKAPCPAVYSNYGLALVGELLAMHYGKMWDELVQERITGPLGMRDTMQHLGALSDRLVPAFFGRATATPWLMDAFSGAGGLRASAADLVLFGRALLAGRNGPLGPAAERLLVSLGEYEGHGIGYAVFIHGPPSDRTYSHSGLTGGFRALLLLDPASGTVIAALASNAQAPVGRLASDWWTYRYPVDDQAITIAPEQLDAYTGVYQVSPEVSLSVVRHAGSLHVRSNNGVFRAYIAVAPDTFTRPAGGARAVFVSDAGRITGMTLEQWGARLVATRTAQAAPVDAVLAPGKARDYTGRYAVPNQGTTIEFDVRDDDGQLSIRSTRFTWAPVLPIAGKTDRFRYDFPDAQVQFERAADGAVQAMVLHQRGELRGVKTLGTP